MQILIVDDDPMMLEILSHALKGAGHEVQTAGNGRDALEILRTGSCRLVISDWEMPEMSGVELCRAIRAGGPTGYVYVILLTARAGSDDTIAGLSAGADDFITKPFNPAELAMRVRVGERILALDARDVTIFAMAKLAESRDPETGAHLERVCSFSRLLAEQLSKHPVHGKVIDASYVQLIYRTSALHDIGKVAIPDCVLLKPGRLSDREFAIMKEHTTLGARTLEAAMREHPEAKFLQMAQEIASSHHERFDGAGYPSHLSGTDIPLCSRIVAVADVYDALSSKRVYKNAFTHDVARSIILEGSGTHFDPDVVEAFLQTEQQFQEIRTHFSDPLSIAA